MTGDEWERHELQGRCYTGRILTAAVAGEIAYSQMFNPPGSGKRIEIMLLQPVPVFSIAINQNIARFDTAVGTEMPFGSIEPLLDFGQSSVVQLRFHNQVGLLGVRWWLFLSSGNRAQTYPPEGAQMGRFLDPGQGIMLNGGISGFLLNSWFWAEVDI